MTNLQRNQRDKEGTKATYGWPSLMERLGESVWRTLLCCLMGDYYMFLCQLSIINYIVNFLFTYYFYIYNDDPMIESRIRKMNVFGVS